MLIFTGCDDFYKKEQVKVNIIDIDPPKYFAIIVYDEKLKVKSRIRRNTYVDTDTDKYSYDYSKYMDKSTYCN